MSITSEYTATHVAFQCAANGHGGLTAFDVRLLVALHEAGGRATTQDIAGTLQSEGSAVRRTATILYRLGLAEGVGSNGGRRRPGIVTLVRLTERGLAVVDDALSHHRVLTTPLEELAA